MGYLLISGSCKRSVAKRMFVLGTSQKKTRNTVGEACYNSAKKATQKLKQFAPSQSLPSRHNPDLPKKDNLLIKPHLFLSLKNKHFFVRSSAHIISGRWNPLFGFPKMAVGSSSLWTLHWSYLLDAGQFFAAKIR